MKLVTKVSNFSVGIDRLISVWEGRSTTLPENSLLAPTGRPADIKLDTLLRQLSVQEKALLALLKPGVRNAFVLTPKHYQTLLDDARLRLAELADQGHPAAGSLRGGAKLIEAEQQLMQLLSAQRKLLVGA